MRFKIISKVKISTKLIIVYTFVFSLTLVVLNASSLFVIQHYLYSEYKFIKRVFIIMVIADLIGAMVSIIVGYIISKAILKPIGYITEAAKNININNLEERLEASGSDDEIQKLINTFNEMIDRLKNSFDRQAQFALDVSHELRTPIAVMQGYAGLLDRWGKNDKDALQKSIEAIKLEANYMANLVEKLLFVAKSDNGIQIVERKEFYLNTLIEEVVEESKIISENYNIFSNRNDVGEIIADYGMIKQMLRILISNSIKFTPKNGKIEINSEIYDKFAQITVSDNGVGIPKNEINNIFNRFYIVDRPKLYEKTGTGLGLAMAKLIVDMHEGSIKVESEEGKWTNIIVTLYSK